MNLKFSCVEFELVLLNAIDEALFTLGEGVKSVFYVYLEKTTNLPKYEIPARIEEFSSAIEELFGAGARFLELLIMKNLHSEVGVVWELNASNPWVLPDLTFKEYVIFVKKYFEEENKYDVKMGIIIDESSILEKYR